jgi:predicted membrane protein
LVQAIFDVDFKTKLKPKAMDYTKNDKMNRKPHCSKNDGLPFMGIFLIVLGVVFLLDRIGIIPHEYRKYLFSWQSLLIFVGLISLFKSHARFPGLILILIGSGFMIPSLFDLPFNVTRLVFPVVLILVGIALVFKARNLKHPHVFFSDTETQSNSERIDEVAIFGGGKRVVSNQNIKGGQITAIFGGVELDMSDADLSDDGAVIEIACIFGGATIIVNPEWDVQVQVTSILGGFSDQRKVYKRTEPNSGKKLIIKGAAIFGGGELKSF